MDSSANKALEILEAYGVNLKKIQTFRRLRTPKDIHYIDINAKGEITFIPSGELVFASHVTRDDYLFLHDCPIGETQHGN